MKVYIAYVQVFGLGELSILGIYASREDAIIRCNEAKEQGRNFDPTQQSPYGKMVLNAFIESHQLQQSSGE